MAVALGIGLVAEVATAVRLGVGLSTAGPGLRAALTPATTSRRWPTCCSGSYFFPFEATSLLLIVAAVGVMLLGRRHAIAAAPTAQAGDPDGGAARRALRDGARAVRTPIAWYLVVSALLFTIGTVGVLVRRNALVIFMSVELQLNAANLALVAFARLGRA